VTQIGASVQGEPIFLHTFGAGLDPLFIFAGIHGSEPTSSFVAQRLIEWLRDNPPAYAGRPIAIAPRTNPDGLKRRQRGNAHGIDLNRNFPASNWARGGGQRYNSGPGAASEPETRAIMQAMEQLNPVAVISIHSISGARQCNNYNGPARPLAELLARHNGYPPTGDIGYPTPGSFGTWAGNDRSIPVITLELPRSQSGAASWEQNRAALLAAVQATPRELGR
jgi:protein MpaA